MTMTVEEIGLLILKLQDDDVRIPEIRKFYRALATNEGMRRNAILVGRMCTLPEQTRKEYCTSGFLFCLASEELVFPAPVTFVGVPANKNFSYKFCNQFRGPWKAHIRELRMQPLPIVGKNRKTVYEVRLSEELASLLKAVQNLWNVPDLYL